jgi:hypothetical protein
MVVVAELRSYTFPGAIAAVNKKKETKSDLWCSVQAVDMHSGSAPVESLPEY